MRLSPFSDLAEKDICCHKNPEAATVAVMLKKVCNFIKKGFSVAKFLRTLILKNICKGLPLKISTSVTNFPKEGFLFNFLVP